jgi:hypothetical protein
MFISGSGECPQSCARARAHDHDRAAAHATREAIEHEVNI